MSIQLCGIVDDRTIRHSRKFKERFFRNRDIVILQLAHILQSTGVADLPDPLHMALHPRNTLLYSIQMLLNDLRWLF